MAQRALPPVGGAPHARRLVEFDAARGEQRSESALHGAVAAPGRLLVRAHDRQNLELEEGAAVRADDGAAAAAGGGAAYTGATPGGGA